MMTLIWWCTAIMAAVSLVMMAVLIVARAIGTIYSARRELAGNAARKAFLEFISTRDVIALLHLLRSIDRRIVADQARDILGLVRGELATQLLDVLDAVGVKKIEQFNLRHGTRPKRLRAAEFLANFQDEASEKALRFVLHDRSDEVRIAAAISLARRGALKTEAEVMEALPRTARNSRRLEEFFEIVARQRKDIVVEIVKNPDMAAEVRAMAIDGLSRTRPSELITFFEKALQPSTEAAVAVPLIRCVAKLKHPRSLEIVRRNLNDPDWRRRLAAIEAVGLLGIVDDELLEELCNAMNSKEWPLRQMASSSLIALGPAGLSRLKAFTTDFRAAGCDIRTDISALGQLSTQDA